MVSGDALDPCHWNEQRKPIDRQGKCAVPGCSSTFFTKADLYQHIRNAHSNEAIPCPFEFVKLPGVRCTAICRSLKALDSHIHNSHSRIRPCPLTGCIQKAQETSSLAEHLKSGAHLFTNTSGANEARGQATPKVQTQTSSLTKCGSLDDPSARVSVPNYHDTTSATEAIPQPQSLAMIHDAQGSSELQFLFYDHSAPHSKDPPKPQPRKQSKRHQSRRKKGDESGDLSPPAQDDRPAADAVYLNQPSHEGYRMSLGSVLNNAPPHFSSQQLPNEAYGGCQPFRSVHAPVIFNGSRRAAPYCRRSNSRAPNNGILAPAPYASVTQHVMRHPSRSQRPVERVALRPQNHRGIPEGRQDHSAFGRYPQFNQPTSSYTTYPTARLPDVLIQQSRDDEEASRLQNGQVMAPHIFGRDFGNNQSQLDNSQPEVQRFPVPTYSQNFGQQVDSYTHSSNWNQGPAAMTSTQLPQPLPAQPNWNYPMQPIQSMRPNYQQNSVNASSPSTSTLRSSHLPESQTSTSAQMPPAVYPDVNFNRTLDQPVASASTQPPQASHDGVGWANHDQMLPRQQQPVDTTPFPTSTAGTSQSHALESAPMSPTTLSMMSARSLETFRRNLDWAQTANNATQQSVDAASTTTPNRAPPPAQTGWGYPMQQPMRPQFIDQQPIYDTQVASATESLLALQHASAGYRMPVQQPMQQLSASESSVSMPVEGPLQVPQDPACQAGVSTQTQVESDFYIDPKVLQQTFDATFDFGTFHRDHYGL